MKKRNLKQDIIKRENVEILRNSDIYAHKRNNPYAKFKMNIPEPAYFKERTFIKSLRNLLLK